MVYTEQSVAKGYQTHRCRKPGCGCEYYGPKDMVCPDCDKKQWMAERRAKCQEKQISDANIREQRRQEGFVARN